MLQRLHRTMLAFLFCTLTLTTLRGAEDVTSDELFCEAEVADCWTCGGSGRKPCNHCGPPESARYTCGHCDSASKVKRVCTKCKGRDLTRLGCPHCGGVDLTLSPCKHCKGSGRLDEKSCIYCAGSGRRGPCLECNGRGTQSACGECAGTGRPPQCPQCDAEFSDEGTCRGCSPQAGICRTCFGGRRLYVVVAAHLSSDELLNAVRKRRSASPIPGAPAETLTVKGTGPGAQLVAEDGSYHGQISETSKRRKVVFVHSYVLEDGRYVRSHFQELPSMLPGQEILVPTVVFDRRPRSNAAPRR